MSRRALFGLIGIIIVSAVVLFFAIGSDWFTNGDFKSYYNYWWQGPPEETEIEENSASEKSTVSLMLENGEDTISSPLSSENFKTFGDDVIGNFGNNTASGSINSGTNIFEDIWDYVIGDISFYFGAGADKASLEPFDTYRVVYKRTLCVTCDGEWLDKHFSQLQEKTFLEVCAEDPPKDSDVGFYCFYRVDLDVSKLLENNFCHSELSLNWDDYYIAPLTNENYFCNLTDSGVMSFYFSTELFEFDNERFRDDLYVIDATAGEQVLVPKILFTSELLMGDNAAVEHVDHSSHNHLSPECMYFDSPAPNGTRPCINSEGELYISTNEEGDINGGEGNNNGDKNEGENVGDKDGNGFPLYPDFTFTDGDDPLFSNYENQEPWTGEDVDELVTNSPYNMILYRFGYKLYSDKCLADNISRSTFGDWYRGVYNSYMLLYGFYYRSYDTNATDLSLDEFVDFIVGNSDGIAALVSYYFYCNQCENQDETPLKPSAWFDYIGEDNMKLLHGFYTKRCNANSVEPVGINEYYSRSIEVYNRMLAWDEERQNQQGNGGSSDKPSVDGDGVNGAGEEKKFKFGAPSFSNFKNIFDPDFWNSLIKGEIAAPDISYGFWIIVGIVAAIVLCPIICAIVKNKRDKD